MAGQACLTLAKRYNRASRADAHRFSGAKRFHRAAVSRHYWRGISANATAPFSNAICAAATHTTGTTTEYSSRKEEPLYGGLKPEPSRRWCSNDVNLSVIQSSVFSSVFKLGIVGVLLEVQCLRCNTVRKWNYPTSLHSSAQGTQGTIIGEILTVILRWDTGNVVIGYRQFCCIPSQ